MAALSEEDLKKILGDDFRAVELAAQKATGVEEEQREIAAKISGAEDKNFTSFASVFVGAALVFSAYFTKITGWGFTIQMAIAIAFILIGIGSYVYFKKQIGTLRERLTMLRQQKAAKAA